MLDRSGAVMVRDSDPSTAGAGFRPARFGLAFPGTAGSVRGALTTVRSALRGMGVPQETCGIVEFVLAEVLNNIVEHAYAGNAAGFVELDLERREGALAFEMRDWGHPMPGSAAPDGQPKDLEVPIPDLPEGGFGWHLIRSLTLDLSYDRTGSANVLRFLVPLNGVATLQ